VRKIEKLLLVIVLTSTYFISSQAADANNLFIEQAENNINFALSDSQPSFKPSEVRGAYEIAARTLAGGAKAIKAAYPTMRSWLIWFLERSNLGNIDTIREWEKSSIQSGFEWLFPFIVGYLTYYYMGWYLGYDQSAFFGYAVGSGAKYIASKIVEKAVKATGLAETLAGKTQAELESMVAGFIPGT
jgi:hypothetical protein